MKNELFKNILLVEIFLFALVGFWFVYNYSKSFYPSKTLVVVGEGKATAIPNIAKIEVGLISEGSDVIKLQEENTKKFNQVVNFLRSQGIEDKDIQTINYSITPKYRYDKFTEIVGYTLSQNISVRIRNVNKLGEILNGVIKNGANNVYGPNFIVDDEKVYFEQARKEAIEDAKKQAERIAKESGIRLGKIISLTFETNQPSIYYPVMFKEMGSGGEGNIPQIQPGSQEIKVWARITYEIK